jgi:hypothetical protein
MADEPIKPGDSVQVGGAGKRWTVSKIDGENAICFDDKAKEVSLPLVTLKKYRPQTASAMWLGKR